VEWTSKSYLEPGLELSFQNSCYFGRSFPHQDIQFKISQHWQVQRPAVGFATATVPVRLKAKRNLLGKVKWDHNPSAHSKRKPDRRRRLRMAPSPLLPTMGWALPHYPGAAVASIPWPASHPFIHSHLMSSRTSSQSREGILDP
jgi:hypothetical protein